MNEETANTAEKAREILSREGFDVETAPAAATEALRAFVASIQPIRELHRKMTADIREGGESRFDVSGPHAAAYGSAAAKHLKAMLSLCRIEWLVESAGWGRIPPPLKNRACAEERKAWRKKVGEKPDPIPRLVRSCEARMLAVECAAGETRNVGTECGETWAVPKSSGKGAESKPEPGLWACPSGNPKSLSIACIERALQESRGRSPQSLHGAMHHEIDRRLFRSDLSLAPKCDASAALDAARKALSRLQSNLAEKRAKPARSASPSL